jgi:hypothetical protein
MPRHVPDDIKRSCLLSVRVSPRMRFGLFVLSRMERATVSVVTQSVLQAVMDGKAELLQYFACPKLRELWDPLPWVRLQNLQEAHPELVSLPERHVLEQVKRVGAEMDAKVWANLQSVYRLDV